MNRNPDQRARSMRIYAELSMTFWTDAINIVAYFINGGPSVSLHFKLPMEAWTRKKVNFLQLKFFCCVLYVHIKSENRDKLDAKATKCLFIRYGSKYFGYRF